MTQQQGTGFVGLSNWLTQVLIPSVQTIRVQNIYDHELTDLAGYPAVTVTATDLLGKYADNTRNARTYRFSIKVFIDRTQQGFGNDKAEGILRAVMDEIIGKIDADITLGGNCIYAFPFTGRFAYVDRQQQNIRLAELILECRDVITYR